jgi:hypothetical protein
MEFRIRRPVGLDRLVARAGRYQRRAQAPQRLAGHHVRYPRLHVAVRRRTLRDGEHLVERALWHLARQKAAHRAPLEDGFVDREHGS